MENAIRVSAGSGGLKPQFYRWHRWTHNTADLKSADEASTPDLQDSCIKHGERTGRRATVPLERQTQAVRARKTVRRATQHAGRLFQRELDAT